MRRIKHVLAVLMILAGACASVMVTFPSTGFAQDVGQEEELTLPPDYEAWEKVATRAEAALAANKASERALEELRQEIVGWRRLFLSAQGENANRIPILQAQIAALGPPPEEGSAETQEISNQREQLLNQLAELMEPEVKAKEAHGRADAIIRAIDSLVRAKRARNLFTQATTPLDPRLWPESFGEFSQSFELATKEFGAAVRSQTKQSVFQKNIVTIIILFVIAGVLIFRGQKWFEKLTRRLSNRTEDAYLRLISFLLSTAQFIVPFVGILAFCAALEATGMLGFRGSVLTDAFPYIALVWLSTRWLSALLFPGDVTIGTLFHLPPQDQAIVRRNIMFLATLWGIAVAITQIAEFDLYSYDTRGVVFLPINILAGVLAFQLGKVLTRVTTDTQSDEDSDARYQERAIRALGRVLMLVAVLGPLLAVLGYQMAGTSLLFRALLSAWFLGVLIPLFGVVRDIYSLITQTDEQRAREALVPVIICLILFLSLLPIFALIWGARVSDLTELWSRLGEGFLIGETRISLNQFLLFLGVFAIGYLITRLVQSTLKGTVLPKTKIDTGGQVAIVSGLGYVGIFLATLIAISTAGINLSSLAIVAGALSVGIGFGLQTIVSNFVSGIILLIERPISEGDWIEVGPNMGTVRDISVRSTRIETFDRTDVIIPNSDLISGTVTNYTRGNLIGRVVIGVGVAYGSDTRKVQTVLEEIARAQPIVSMNPPPSVILKGFGADSIDFEIRAVLRDVNFILDVRSEINHQIAERFAQEGIEIPFAQRDIWLRNPEALRAVGAPSDENNET